MLRHFMLSLVCLWIVSPVVLAQDEADTVYVRVANLAPSLEQVDVSINAETLFESLVYGMVSEWQALATDSLTVSIDAETTPLKVIDAEAGEWLTLVLNTVDDLLRVDVVREDVSATAPDESRVTLYYGLQSDASEDAVDVFLDDTLFTRGLGSGQSLTVNVIANTYSVRLAEPDANGETLVEVEEVLLEEGVIYLLVVYGEADAPQNLLLISETPTPEATPIPTLSPTASPDGKAGLRLAHLSSGTPPIDIYINGERGTWRTLRFPDFSSWTAIPSGVYRIAITLADEPLSEALLPPMDVTLEAGTFTNLMLIGALANNTLELHEIEETYSELRQNATRLSVFNAHPGAGPITATLDNGVELVSQLGYPGFFGSNDGFTSMILDAEVYDLTFTAGAEDELLFELPGRKLHAGRSYLIAVISADPPFFLTFSDMSETEALLRADE